MRRTKAQRNQDCIHWGHCPNPLLPSPLQTLFSSSGSLMLFPTSRSLCCNVLQNGCRDNIEMKGVKSVDFLWSQRDLSLTWWVRPHGRSMPYARAARQWEIRPTSTLRGIKRTRALMWQRIRGLVRACRHGAGYPVNYNDPDREEQEMVCLEVWMCSFCLFFSIAF